MTTRRALWSMVETLYGVRFPLTWAEYLQLDAVYRTWEQAYRNAGLLIENAITY